MSTLMMSNPDPGVFEAAAHGDNGRLVALLEEDPDLVWAWSFDGFTPLHLACWYRHPKATEALLLIEGVDIEAVSRNGMAVRPIHSAVTGGNVDVVVALLDLGAQVNAPRFDGQTALDMATRAADSELVQILIKYGGEPSHPPVDRKKPEITLL